MIISQLRALHLILRTADQICFPFEIKTFWHSRNKNKVLIARYRANAVRNLHSPS